MRILFFLSLLTFSSCYNELKSPELSNIEFTITYQENGRIKDIGKYIDGYKEGEWKEYSIRNNNILNIGKYVNGNKEGEWKTYNKNGALIKEGKYLNGMRKGEWKDYSEYGLSLIHI